MSIDRLSGKNPKQADGLKPSSSGRSEKKSDAAPARSAGPTPPSDQVRISSEVQSSVESQEIPRGEVSPERMQEIGGRIASRFYDSPEVVDLVARSILSELTGGAAQ